VDENPDLPANDGHGNELGKAVIHGLSKTTITQVMASGLVDSNLDAHNDNERAP
jgi:hypothetical protein